MNGRAVPPLGDSPEDSGHPHCRFSQQVWQPQAWQDPAGVPGGRGPTRPAGAPPHGSVPQLAGDGVTKEAMAVAFAGEASLSKRVLSTRVPARLG